MKKIFAKQSLHKFRFFLLLTLLIFTNHAFTQSQALFVKNDAANPLQHLQVASGRQSHPTFVDIDGDGDMDCFSGEFNYSKNGVVNSHISFYKNEGDAKHPLFKEMKAAQNPLSAIAITGSLIPRFADIDGDGDADCFIADNSGSISFYENTGTAKQAKFEKKSAAFNPLSNIKFSGVSINQFLLVDADKDGDFDCLLSDADGNEMYYQNSGSLTHAKFVATDKTNNPFAFIDNASVNTISFYDWNKDGNADLFVNTTYYQNDYGHFQKVSSGPIVPNDDAVATGFVDLNDDGNSEMVSGTADGRFVYNTIAKVDTKQTLSLIVSPNPTTKSFTLTLAPSTEKRTLQIVNENGKVISIQTINGNQYTFGDGLVKGVYFVQLYSSGIKTGEQKIVKL